MSETNRALLVHFLEATETTDFREHLNISRLLVKFFQKWVMSSNAVPAGKLDVIRTKTSARSKPSKLTMFASLPDSNLREIGTEQIWLIPPASLTDATYIEEDPRVREFFYNLFGAG